MPQENGSERSPTRRERTYLPVIYHLTRSGEPVIAAQIARWLDAAPPTVTQVLQQFVARGLLVRDSRGAITLTAAGVTLAETLVRRHRLLECFLLDIVGIPWEQVHQEALHLEAGISPVLGERIIALVGAATTCPHGNPIPGQASASGTQVRLDEVAAETTFTIRRVTAEAEENSDLLRYLAANVLVPGTRVYIVATSSVYGVTLRIGSRTLGVPLEIAAVLWGEAEPPAD